VRGEVTRIAQDWKGRFGWNRREMGGIKCHSSKDSIAFKLEERGAQDTKKSGKDRICRKAVARSKRKMLLQVLKTIPPLLYDQRKAKKRGRAQLQKTARGPQNRVSGKGNGET